MIGYLDYHVDVFPRADCIAVAVCWKHFDDGKYLPDPGTPSPWWEEIREGGRLTRLLYGGMNDRIAKAVARLDARAAAVKARTAHYQQFV